MKYKPRVVLVVYQLILWYTEPLQIVADSHHEGYKLGRRVGDVLHSTQNQFLSFQTKYVAGQDLSTVQTSSRDFIQIQPNRGQKDLLVALSVLLYYHVIALRQGLHILDTGRVDDIPTIAEINISNVQSELLGKIFCLTRAFLFRQFGGNLIDIMNISDTIEKKKIQLRPIFAV